jgi:hypothetical protein
MRPALRIVFHNLTPSAAIDEDIRRRIDKLSLLCHRITGCRVTIEAPHGTITMRTGATMRRKPRRSGFRRKHE